MVLHLSHDQDLSDDEEAALAVGRHGISTNLETPNWMHSDEHANL